MSAFYDGRHSKVTSSNVGPATLPRDALNFYYDDETVGGTVATGKEESVPQDALPQGTEQVYSSKHDAKLWSRTHIERLNEYETGGNLDKDLNIGNQAYNSFRNQLDKKGFISYHNYTLQPANKRR